MTVVRAAAEHLAAALQPLAEALADPGAYRALMARLGWDARSIPPEWRRLADDIARVSAAVDQLGDDPGLAELAPAVGAFAGLAATIGELSTAPAGLDTSAVLGELRDSLLERLLVEHCAAQLPALFGMLRLLGVICAERRRAEESRPTHTRYRIDSGRIRELANDPGAWLRASYGWGSDLFDEDAVLGALLDLSLRLGLRGRLARADAEVPALAGLSIGKAVLELPLIDAVLSGNELQLGVQIAVLPPAPGMLPGIAFAPRIPGLSGGPLALAPNVDLRLIAGGSGPVELGVVVRPEGALVQWPGGASGEGFGVELSARMPLRIGRATGTRLELAGVTFELHVERDDVGDLVITKLRADGAAVVLAGGDQDGVLSRVLGGRELRVPIPAELLLSSRDGISFALGEIDAALAGPLSIGPVRLDDPRLAIAAPGDVVSLAVTAGAGVTLGPVGLHLDRLGARLALDTARPGALGLGTLDAGPVWPEGAGISIDAGVVRGAGHVTRDPAIGSYEGAVQLRVLDIDAQGAAIVSSRGSDGAELTSVAALVSARFPGIPLGFGFTLDGLGALFALNRRADEDRMRAAVRAGQLQGLLFPADPQAGLGGVLVRMRELFPPAPGRYLAGPAARIGWGTPRVLGADIAALVEGPPPLRVVVLGSASLGLPSLDRRVVDINLDVLGVLDLGRRTLAVDASLHHSTIAGYELTGDMALRTGWGESPHFLLSIGGFHPRFDPPPNFPALRRVALAIGDNPSLRLAAYLALTSNTVQLGAHVDLAYHASRLQIGGQLHFDALVELRPLRFEVDIGARVAISYRGHDIASAKLDFLLTGPRPWHAHGTATIGILWWDVSVGFEVTWGNPAPPALPPPPDPAALLRDALREPRAIAGELPADEKAWIVLRERTEPGIPRIHPLASLVIRQRAIPLRYRITRVASAPLAAPIELVLTTVRIDGSNVPAPGVVHDSFALGQFSTLRDDERLAAPSFEPMPSGVRVGDGAVALGATASAPLDPITVIDDPLAPPATPVSAPPSPRLLEILHAHQHLSTELRRVVVVHPARYALASIANLTAAMEPSATGTSYGALRERVRGASAALQVVHVSELARNS